MFSDGEVNSLRFTLHAEPAKTAGIVMSRDMRILEPDTIPADLAAEEPAEFVTMEPRFRLAASLSTRLERRYVCSLIAILRTGRRPSFE